MPQDKPQTTAEAILLAGGLGARLASVLPGQPKCLAPVLGRPFLFHLFDQLYGQGVRRIVLSLGYRSDQIISALVDYRQTDLKIDHLVEAAPLGTGGGLRHVLGQTGHESLLVLNADSYIPFSLKDFSAFHRQGKWKTSLVSVFLKDAGRFGLLEIAPTGQVRSFKEKAAGSSGFINAGIYLIERELLAALPENVPLSLERDILPTLTAPGQLGAMCVPGPFIDIGIPEDFARAESFLAGLKSLEERLEGPNAL
ncbi:MAG: nucleotidyltransferase family protein [Alphaproteobacteria bacterium]|nr:nucleotidyltransferase family protein [Alphaproteobacteria bacterium]